METTDEMCKARIRKIKKKAGYRSSAVASVGEQLTLDNLTTNTSQETVCKTSIAIKH